MFSGAIIIIIFQKKTWGDRNHYDLCLNTAELGYEKAAEILAAAAK